MLKHIVMWKFKAEACGKTKSENMRFVKESLLKLKGVIPELIAAEAGEDALHSPASYDMALVCTFDNIENMKAYRGNPAHVRISDYIKLVTFDRCTADFYTDSRI